MDGCCIVLFWHPDLRSVFWLLSFLLVCLPCVWFEQAHHALWGCGGPKGLSYQVSLGCCRTFALDFTVFTHFTVCYVGLGSFSHTYHMLTYDHISFPYRLQMSNTFYESAGQNWFTLDSVHIHYNWTHEATFNATDVYAPSTNSYHCQHVSSLQKYDTLLVPSSNTDNAANWHITFTDFQVCIRVLFSVRPGCQYILVSTYI